MTVVLHCYIRHCRSSLLCTESLILCSTVQSEWCNTLSTVATPSVWWWSSSWQLHHHCHSRWQYTHYPWNDCFMYSVLQRDPHRQHSGH